MKIYETALGAKVSGRNTNMPGTLEGEIIKRLRAITRLQTQARKLRRQLKATQQSLREERRFLRQLQASFRGEAPGRGPHETIRRGCWNPSPRQQKVSEADARQGGSLEG